MTRSEAARKWLIHTALSYLGTPYVWGGDDPAGFDCSGFVLECLKSVGIFPGRTDHTADSLMQSLKGTILDAPEAGALLFALDRSGRATHVVICLDPWFQIGANGGTSATIDSHAAWRRNAFVKIRPIQTKSESRRIVLPEY